ncbi:MAG TPA: HDOD domain-containing protein [Gallionellaceae bacterium]|nr:HDOD domain-containing protein [Gallionellaceae bacterium]
MNTSSTPVNLREAIKSLDSLPTLPLIAQKLLALKTDTDEGQKQLLLLIDQDPQILAKIIGLANAPIYGSSRKIGSISEAAIVLGINRIKSVASGIAVMSLKAGSPTGNLNMQDLWMHNLGIAFAMLAIGRAMPRQIRPADDYIFLAGMLHDIGYIALDYLDPKRSNELHTYQAAAPGRPVLEIENSLLDISHDELGAELARHWNLPSEIISVIRYHHTPDAPDAPSDQPLIRMVYIAEKILPSFGMGEHVNPGISDSDWEALSIVPANAEEILTQAAEQADQATLFAASLG